MTDTTMLIDILLLALIPIFAGIVWFALPAVNTKGKK